MCCSFGSSCTLCRGRRSDAEPPDPPQSIPTNTARDPSGSWKFPANSGPRTAVRTLLPDSRDRSSPCRQTNNLCRASKVWQLRKNSTCCLKISNKCQTSDRRTVRFPAMFQPSAAPPLPPNTSPSQLKDEISATEGVSSPAWRDEEASPGSTLADFMSCCRASPCHAGC